MNEDLITLLACPIDQSAPLELREVVRSGAGIEKGDVACSMCKSRFPILSGIPSFLALDGDPALELKRREMEARDDSFRQAAISDVPVERLPELDALRSGVGDCQGLSVLDAGCGAGLMTPSVGMASRVVALDFSWQGLLKFRDLPATVVDRVHGDVCRLPFRSESFDACISSQVLEHVPSREMRRIFLAELGRTLKAGARLVITTYNWDRARRERGVPKEGTHRNGIFYHCYDPDELCAELSNDFEVEAIWGVQVLLPKTHRLRMALGSKNVYWDRFWRTKGLARSYGNLLQALARRRIRV